MSYLRPLTQPTTQPPNPPTPQPTNSPTVHHQEQAYLRKYPGHARLEWGNKLQKYKPPGSDATLEVTLWDLVSVRWGLLRAG